MSASQVSGYLMHDVTLEYQLFSQKLILFGVWLQDFLTMSTGKRKYDEIASSGYYLPQRDGAGDVELCSSPSEVYDDKVSVSSKLTLFFSDIESYICCEHK